MPLHPLPLHPFLANRDRGHEGKALRSLVGFIPSKEINVKEGVSRARAHSLLRQL